MNQEQKKPVFDADNHYYEALDAFTRHLDPKTSSRTVEWGEFSGRKYHVIGGKVARVVANPTFNPIAKPGAAYEFFRGNAPMKKYEEYLVDREPIRPEYRDRDARLQVMDQWGLQSCWLFPTLGVLYEELLRHDPWAVVQTFRAFNRWVQDDWGCNYQNRIFAAPYMTLADVDEAIKELEWALQQDARVICMRPAAPTTATGQFSPGHRMFDPFWARVNEAGVTVVVHASNSGYSTNGYAAQDHFGGGTLGDEGGPTVKMFSLERAVGDFIATLVFDRVFDRFPNLRFASVENGSSFVKPLLKELTSAASKVPGYFKEDPAETFKRHVWVNPFWEDNVFELVKLLGADRVLFGSDWPHMEGLEKPLDILSHIDELDANQQRKFLYDNTTTLNTRRHA